MGRTEPIIHKVEKNMPWGFVMRRAIDRKWAKRLRNKTIRRLLKIAAGKPDRAE